MAALPNWPYPARVAHRGAGKLAPENTLAAVRLGSAHGYRMVEIDVKLSGDGVAFLLHDDTLDRTTNGRGRADGRTWAELAQLDAGSWHSPAFAGEPLPTFAAVARHCRANRIAVNVEIKPMPGLERTTGAAIALDALAHWTGADVAPLLSSFSDVALEAAREVAPGLPRAWLSENARDNWIQRATELGCIAIDLDHRLLSAEVVRAAHAAGLRVATWTVNDPARAATLAEWGADTIITDAIDVIPPG